MKKPDGNVEYIDTTGTVRVFFDFSERDDVSKLRVCGNGIVSDKRNYYDVKTGQIKF